eukprot:10372643-Ditylum_brightwellii.AAC.1
MSNPMYMPVQSVTVIIQCHIIIWNIQRHATAIQQYNNAKLSEVLPIHNAHHDNRDTNWRYIACLSHLPLRPPRHHHGSPATII